jgi:putative SOS response-associated peptidase YedK
MCGRFAQTKELTILISRFRFIIEDLKIRKRYNIAPGQDAGVIVSDNNARRLKMMRWGLVPFFTKEAPSSGRMINARAETLSQKSSFRNSLKNKRCLVPADGYYEWKKIPGETTKIPHFFSLKKGEAFAFAGLWDSWENPEGGVLSSFTIITTTANEKGLPIHDRMPVILSPKDESLWLEPLMKNTEQLLSVLKPYPAKDMELYEVSPLVNSPANDVPQCVERVSPTRQGILFSE